MSDSDRRPAYYSARPGGWRDWWSILHPPYTAWHLSYVVIGASLAPHLDSVRLLATLLAFFAAAGCKFGAHCALELRMQNFFVRLRVGLEQAQINPVAFHHMLGQMLDLKLQLRLPHGMRSAFLL